MARAPGDEEESRRHGPLRHRSRRTRSACRWPASGTSANAWGGITSWRWRSCAVSAAARSVACCRPGPCAATRRIGERTGALGRQGYGQRSDQAARPEARRRKIRARAAQVTRQVLYRNRSMSIRSMVSLSRNEPATKSPPGEMVKIPRGLGTVTIGDARAAVSS